MRRGGRFYVPIALTGCTFQTSHSPIAPGSEILIRPNHPLIFSSPTNRSDRRPLQISVLARTKYIVGRYFICCYLYTTGHPTLSTPTRNHRPA